VLDLSSELLNICYLVAIPPEKFLKVLEFFLFLELGFEGSKVSLNLIFTRATLC